MTIYHLNKFSVAVIPFISLGCFHPDLVGDPVNPNFSIRENFLKSPAFEQDYKNALEKKEMIEVTSDSIFFQGDGGRSSLIVVVSGGKMLACQHVDFQIPTDGYYVLREGKWIKGSLEDWNKLMGIHRLARR